jgi:hypothetical protein
LPNTTGEKTINNSIETIKAFVSEKRRLGLGLMVFCLLNVGCKLRNTENRGFVKFLCEILNNLDEFCEKKEVSRQIAKHLREYRHRAVHASRLSQKEYLEARAFLLDELIPSLIVLVGSYKFAHYEFLVLVLSIRSKVITIACTRLSTVVPMIKGSFSGTVLSRSRVSENIRSSFTHSERVACEIPIFNILSELLFLPVSLSLGLYSIVL